MTTTTMPAEQKRRTGLVLPTVLIGLGVLFLLNSLGILGRDLWEAIVNLWPVLLIAVGLDLVLGRRSAARSTLIAITMFSVLVAGLWTSGWWLRSTPIATDTISQPAGAAARAEVEIDMGLGTLRVGALAEGDQLIAGTAAHYTRDSVMSDFSLSGDTAFYKLRTGRQVGGLPLVSPKDDQLVWDLRLSQRVPMQLKISTGVGTSTIDLTRLHIDDLNVDSGVGTTTVSLPSTGRVQANVSGGVGTTTIIIPAGVAARIEASAGLGGTNVIGNFQKQGSIYVSPSYDTAEDRVDLIVTGGVGGITIKQAGR